MATNETAVMHKIFRLATEGLVSRDGFQKVKPYRLTRSTEELQFVIEIERWPDKSGRFFRVPWGINVPAEQRFNELDRPLTAEYSTLNGDLGGAMGRGRGFLTVRFPSARRAISDVVLSAVRPKSEDEAAGLIRDGIESHVLQIFRPLQTRSDLADWIQASGKFLSRGGIWPDNEFTQARVVAILYALSGRHDQAEEAMAKYLSSADRNDAVDRSFEQRIRAILGS